jgi:sec-independent protein translocase protein TatC
MLHHLLEIRKRAIHVLVCFVCLFTLFFFFASDLFYLLVKPLIASLPIENSLIATQITSPVFIPISLAADAAILCTAPIFLWQAWRFIAPALYRHEKQTLRIVIISSMVLFCSGVIFCFYLVLPFMFQLFAKAVPFGVKMMPDMANSLDFITRMLLLFGFCFQVPLVCLTLVRLNWVDVAKLKQIRPYVIVAAFTLGMLLTPPDVLSQITLALPLCVLYEVGIFMAQWANREGRSRQC